MSIYIALPDNLSKHLAATVDYINAQEEFPTKELYKRAIATRYSGSVDVLSLVHIQYYYSGAGAVFPLVLTKTYWTACNCDYGSVYL